MQTPPSPNIVASPLTSRNGKKELEHMGGRMCQMLLRAVPGYFRIEPWDAPNEPCTLEREPRLLELKSDSAEHSDRAD